MISALALISLSLRGHQGPPAVCLYFMSGKLLGTDKRKTLSSKEESFTFHSACVWMN